MFVIPEEDRSDKWFESFRKFIVQIAPEWIQDEKGATSEDITQLEEKCCLADGIKLPLSKEYITYLQNMGGKYVSFRYKQIEFSYDPIYNFNQAGCFSGTLGSPYLAIASQDIDSCEELCYFLWPNEYCTDAPLIMTQWGERETIKIADSLRQYLCCQAFLALGNRQFPHEYEYSLKCESSYTPPSEAEAWAAAGRKPCEENSERYLENMGFSIQSQKIQSILSKHGYQEVWFSTPLDQVWLQEDSFCSLSRNFDPDGMFDTVIGKICACDQAQIQPLIDDFSQINYQCIEKKWRSDIPAFLQKELLDGLIFP